METKNYEKFKDPYLTSNGFLLLILYVYLDIKK
jgi:hypothetical protein